MAKQPAATLSKHLLVEASRFFLYPTTTYRSKVGLAAQKILDDAFRNLVEWRKTFTPLRNVGSSKLLFDDPNALDQFYSSELLRAVPEMVERTVSLAATSLPRDSIESFVYLREASNCYIFGLPQAAVALSRSAIEVPLKAAVGKQIGKEKAEELGFFNLLEYAGKARLLPKSDLDLAHKVRLAADSVLHEEPTTSSEARQIIEAARTVVSVLTRKAG